MKGNYLAGKPRPVAEDLHNKKELLFCQLKNWVKIFFKLRRKE